MAIINDPRTGDDFLDLLIASGVSDKTIQQVSREIEMYVRSLTREEVREYIKISNRISKRL